MQWHPSRACRWTMSHPAAGVDPSNWSALSVGHLQNVHRNGDVLVGDLLIHAARAIDAIRNQNDAALRSSAVRRSPKPSTMRKPRPSPNPFWADRSIFWVTLTAPAWRSRHRCNIGRARNEAVRSISAWIIT